MTPQMIAALEAATSHARMSLVARCEFEGSAEFIAPADVWRALAVPISEWQPGDSSGPVDHRLVLAVDALAEHQAYALPRWLASSGDDLLVACGLEVEAARMRVLEMRHAIWEATRQAWPESDTAE